MMKFNTDNNIGKQKKKVKKHVYVPFIQFLGGWKW